MSDKPQVVLWAPRSALIKLCGISLLERNVRLLQRLGFSKAVIVTPDSEVGVTANEPPSWARREIRTELRMVPKEDLTLGQLRELIDRDQPILFLPADNYYDTRLLEKLEASIGTTALIDSDPPAALSPSLTNDQKRLLMLERETPDGPQGRGYNAVLRFSGAALLDSSFVNQNDDKERVSQAIEREARHFIDAAMLPDYLPSMRRHLRPVWFSAPAPEHRRRAERLILDSTQKLPRLFHTWAENAVVTLIWRTPITPMQVTWFAFGLGWVVTIGFLLGWLWLATLLALFVAILDGVDGKLARVKVETTKFGEWEHYLDYSFEISWWLALGYYFYRIDALPSGLMVALAMIAIELLERPFGRRIHLRTGVSPNDYAPIDRAFRYVWARRDIFLWIFSVGLIFHRPVQAFIAMCVWQTVTTCFSIARWLSICVFNSTSSSIGTPEHLPK